MHEISKEREDYMVQEVPIGRNAKYLVKMNGSPFAGFDTMEEAEKYVKMMKDCKKGGKKGDNAPKAACADLNWSIETR